MITAQALSIVAIAISWVSIYGLLAGLVTFIMLQVAWCCKMNKAGFIVAGVFGAIAGAIEAIVAILILVAGEQACIDTYYYTSDEQACWSALIVAASLGLASACLWIATAACVFVFACGSRLAKFQSDEQSGDSVVPTATVFMGGDESVSKKPEQNV